MEIVLSSGSEHAQIQKKSYRDLVDTSLKKKNLLLNSKAFFLAESIFYSTV